MIAPPACASCQKLGEIWCVACQESVHPLTGPLCSQCGLPSAKSPCPICQSHPAPLRLRSALWHEGTVRLAIHRLKYEGCTALAVPLADQLAQAWLKWELSADLIIPIPLHPQREMERGYNQAAEIGRAFARKIALPYHDNFLHRTRHTPPQVQQSNRTQRLQNVANAFRTSPQAPLSHKRIILLDDVATTGATLISAAQALLASGAHEVIGITVTRATFPHNPDNLLNPSTATPLANAKRKAVVN